VDTLAHRGGVCAQSCVWSAIRELDLSIKPKLLLEEGKVINTVQKTVSVYGGVIHMKQQSINVIPDGGWREIVMLFFEAFAL